MKKFKMKDLQRYIANNEGGKSETSIGNVREIIALISDCVVDDPKVLAMLLQNGIRRQKRRQK